MFEILLNWHGNLCELCSSAVMGKLQNFTIEFESPYGVFISGQAAAGNVIIQLSEATNLSGQ